MEPTTSHNQRGAGAEWAGGEVFVGRGPEEAEQHCGTMRRHSDKVNVRFCLYKTPLRNRS